MSVAAHHHPARPGGLRVAWQELIRRRRRRLLAQGFEAVLRDAREPRGTWMSARVPVQREQVLDAEPDIERLIGRLRGERPVDEEGMRLVRDLLVERDSPLFEPAEPGTLRRRVRVICEAVE
jgi:hypothetical protein